MTNSDEGMFGCTPAINQYVKVGSGERLEIAKKGCKQCTIVQENRWKIQVTLHNVYYVQKRWYNLFSILGALKRGWQKKIRLESEYSSNSQTVICQRKGSEIYKM